MTHLPWAYSDPIDGQGMDDEDRGYSEPLRCTHCGDELDYEECDQCGGEGYFDDEQLQELDPLWYQPGDTERCEQCSGTGGWHLCRNTEGNTMTHDTLTPEQWQIEARARRDAQRPKETTKRKGKTPEAKVTAECRAYLKQIGALVLRTGAGMAEIDGRKITIGRAGSSDDTALLQGGWWLSLEYKAEHGRLSDLQRRYGERVAALGGVFVVARSRDDVRAALVARFGEELVRGWETKR